jgi:hypothetical protein
MMIYFLKKMSKIDRDQTQMREIFLNKSKSLLKFKKIKIKELNLLYKQIKILVKMNLDRNFIKNNKV